MKRVYYARAISLYDTLQDARDIKLLEQMGFEVVNPNDKKLSARYKKEGMEVFYEVVESCDGLAFRAFQDGSIGAGVYGEMQRAKELGKFIFELPTVTSKRILSIEDTREYLSLIGKR